MAGHASLLKNLLNGWTLSPIVTLSSGLPFTVTSGEDNNYDWNNNDRANVVGDLRANHQHAGHAPVAAWAAAHILMIVVTVDGAGDGIRTRDINLGKVALYQLSYSRLEGPKRHSPTSLLRKSIHVLVTLEVYLCHTLPHPLFGGGPITCDRF